MAGIENIPAFVRDMDRDTAIIGEEQGISKDQVKRYIRLTELIPDILTMVDSGQIALSPAVELSFLRVEEQQNLLETMQSEDCTPSHAQAIRMKKLSQENSLDMDAIFTILTEVKPNQQEQIKLKKDSIKRYFPKDYTTKQMEEIIVKLLEQWQRKRQQHRDIR